ncbi:hypothetical protein HDU98_012327, partial [Podochytrium sp. JEL0797]
VFINVMLSSLFMAAILKHVNNTDKSWDSYAKMSYILSCDVRGAFLDTFAQLVKLFLQLAWWLPTSQTIYGIHLCDFLKVVAAHWFVNDVVKNMHEAGGKSSKKGVVGGAGGNSNNQSPKAISMKAAQFLKGDGGSAGTGKAIATANFGSTETLRPQSGPQAATSFANFAVKMAAAGKSTDSLRSGSVGEVAGIRAARSSENIAVKTPPREGQPKF